MNRYTRDEMIIIKNSILLGDYLETDPLKVMAEMLQQLLDERAELVEKLNDMLAVRQGFLEYFGKEEIATAEKDLLEEILKHIEEKE